MCLNTSFYNPFLLVGHTELEITRPPYKFHQVKTNKANNIILL